MIKALGIDNDKSGCSYHRIRLPWQYAGNHLATFDGTTLEERLKEAEIVVWNRDYPAGGGEVAKKAKEKYGFKVCVDLDDHWQLYPGHYLYDHWQRTKTGKAIKDNIRLADVVTVTTERLATAVRQLHDNVHVIPNALPYGHGQFQEPAGINPRKTFNFMYAGQKSHLHDVKMVKNALLSISKENTSACFFLAGYSESPDKVWKQIEEEFTSNGRLANYQRIENRPLENYMSVYRHADAVIVPLEPNDFNSYKSNLKILEAGVYGLPVICQQVPPYSDCTAPVLFATDTESWKRQMRQLLTDKHYAAAKGAEISSWCREHHNIISWNEKRFSIYKNTINEHN